jgi:transcriptional regulator with XRE-family HTH domain
MGDGTVPDAVEPGIGGVLRRWRKIRRLSQLDLSLAAGVSTRHLSFLETGRSRPSRSMVLRLAGTLEMPLRERNELLVAAGFVPQYGERALSDAGLAPVQRALVRILDRHEPYPAFVLDREWNILLANRAHHRFLALLLPEGADPGEPVNVARLLLDPGLLRPRIHDWDLVAHVVGRRVCRRLQAPGLPSAARTRLKTLLDLPGVRQAIEQVQAPPEAAVLVPLGFEIGGRTLSWFSTLATIGTPQDVTLEELVIETLFPADDATERAVRAHSI